MTGLFSPVMAGLDPAIHAGMTADPETWMPGSSPGMTAEGKAAGGYRRRDLGV